MVEGYTEAEMGGRIGHRRHQRRRIGQRDLHGAHATRHSHSPLNIVGAEHVGGKQPVGKQPVEQATQASSRS